mmetsp:Transcript_3619/g.480  ORF Transcript_3619/g.480 Transcript_3619/m.480 type:complete len:101 (-) Transcript_3619:1233-1535(-)
MPLSLLSHWYCEVQQHGLGLKVVEYHGTKTKNLDLSADIVLTSYGTLLSEYKRQGILHRTSWLRVILDEAHIIKNPLNTTAAACFALRANNKWVLTGTPI